MTTKYCAMFRIGGVHFLFRKIIGSRANEFSANWRIRSSAIILTIIIGFLGVVAAGFADSERGRWFNPKETRANMPTSNPAATVTVSTQTELTNALNAATAGTTILLQDGYYGDLKISNKSFSDYVTIKSADADGGAVFHSINLAGANGVDHLRFDNITIDRPLATGEPYYTNAVYVVRSSNIEFLNSEFHGSVDGNYDNDGYGLTVDYSTNIRVEGCEFHDLEAAALFSQDKNVSFVNNTVHDNHRDGLNFAATQNVLIEDNVMYRFHTGEAHPDFIQFLTAGTTVGSKDVIIRGNLLYEAGGGSVQGIFINDEASVGYDNFLIENNVIHNSILHGISVTRGMSNLTIRNNTVLTRVGGEAPISNIVLDKIFGDNIEIYNNVTTGLITAGSGAILTNNLIVQYIDKIAGNYYGSIFIDALNGDQPQDFLPVPGGATDFGKGLGAEQLLATIDKPAVYIQSSTAAAGVESQTVTFKAVPYPGGDYPAGTTNYQWNFGDGTKAVGQTVTHEFKEAGQHQISVVVEGAGRSETVDKQINVESPLLVHIAFDNALVNQGKSGGDLVWRGSPSYATGLDGQAANFTASGTNSVALSKVSPALSGMNQLTLSFDFSTNSVATARPLFLYEGYGIHFSDKWVAFYLSTGGGFSQVISVQAPQAFDGGWHHLTATYDALTGTAKLYLDGEVIGSKVGISGRVSLVGGRDLMIGTDTWGKNFDGQIDNLRIYRGIVPPDQEQQILDRLRGGKDASLEGDDGANVLTGGEGDDTIDGRGGDDVLVGGAGDDQLAGGDGLDTADYSAAAGGVAVNLATGIATGEGTDALSGIEAVFGSAFADNLRGDPSANLFIGGEGNDTLSGGEGADTLIGGAGDDLLAGGSGLDRLDGGDGNDTADFRHTSAPVTIDLVAGIADFGVSGKETLISIENVIGSNGANTITGTAAANRLDGAGGDDTLNGADGNDTLIGGAGDDLLCGGFGLDRLDGGAGNDTADFRHTASPVSIDLVAGIADFGSLGKETLISIENVVGSNGANTIIGTDGANRLDGAAGSDTLSGGAGDDTLIGGTGYDVLEGGAGNDRFVFALGDGSDRILDFESGSDAIDLVGTGLFGWDDLRGRMVQLGENTLLWLAPGATITLVGVAVDELQAADFNIVASAADLLV